MKNTNKIILISILAVCSIIGFMVRLPRVFHHFDKELHAIFYFIATTLSCILFPKRWLFLSISLTLFGIIIEYAQAFSNKISIRIIGKAIHGRFDLADIKSNIIGVFCGLLLFLLFQISIKPKE